VSWRPVVAGSTFTIYVLAIPVTCRPGRPLL